jgi:hypothetical protein
MVVSGEIEESVGLAVGAERATELLNVAAFVSGDFAFAERGRELPSSVPGD